MNILVACEESQAVTLALREHGHRAYSCDISPCSGSRPEWHIMGDVLPLLDYGWDMIIAFPPCTYLTTTANRWYNVARYGDKAARRHLYREKAVNFFMCIANAKCGKIAIENPQGTMSTRYRRPDQVIQPWQFGDPFEKRTCLWLKGLPVLQPTEIVEPPPRRYYKSGKSHPAWYDCAGHTPLGRAKMRSKTFPGVARAMAEQWG